ncbi:MAG: hypothetical protein N3B10_01480 [Armatimonadetes bacterium]|nr:hypothetical protein [Armatimonadota bacterium]
MDGQSKTDGTVKLWFAKAKSCRQLGFTDMSTTFTFIGALASSSDVSLKRQMTFFSLLKTFRRLYDSVLMA